MHRIALSVLAFALLPLASSAEEVLNLPSGPCACISERRVERRCVDRSKGESFESIKEEFRRASGACDPRAGCTPGHQVQYRYCARNTSERKKR